MKIIVFLRASVSGSGWQEQYGITPDSVSSGPQCGSIGAGVCNGAGGSGAGAGGLEAGSCDENGHWAEEETI